MLIGTQILRTGLHYAATSACCTNSLRRCCYKHTDTATNQVTVFIFVVSCTLRYSICQVVDVNITVTLHHTNTKITMQIFMVSKFPLELGTLSDSNQLRTSSEPARVTEFGFN